MFWKTTPHEFQFREADGSNTNIHIQGERHFLVQTLTWGSDRWNKHFLLISGLVENVLLKSYKDFKFEMDWRQIRY